jgi:hypothetical protein
MQVRQVAIHKETFDEQKAISQRRQLLRRRQEPRPRSVWLFFYVEKAIPAQLEDGPASSSLWTL